MAGVTGVTTQRRTEMSTRKLLEAAAELIAELGYERTTLVAIGQRAGYSHGLVTQRFGSKDGLLHALVQRMTTDWAVVHLDTELNGADGIDGVEFLLREIRDSVLRQPTLGRALYSLMFEAVRIPALHADMVELHRELRQRVADVVEQARDRGEVRADVRPGAFAGLVVSTLRGAAYQWLLDPEFPYAETVTDLIATVRRDLAAGPTPPTDVPPEAR